MLHVASLLRHPALPLLLLPVCLRLLVGGYLPQVDLRLVHLSLVDPLPGLAGPLPVWQLRRRLGPTQARPLRQAAHLQLQLARLLEWRPWVAQFLPRLLHWFHSLHPVASSCPAEVASFWTLPRRQLQALRQRAARCPSDLMCFQELTLEEPVALLLDSESSQSLEGVPVNDFDWQEVPAQAALQDYL